MKLKIGKLKHNAEPAYTAPMPIPQIVIVPEPAKPEEYVNTREGMELLRAFESFLAAIKSLIIRPGARKTQKENRKKSAADGEEAERADRKA